MPKEDIGVDKRMKPVVVAGTRPEIIKIAPVIRALNQAKLPRVFVHCGQHYDYNMSQQFIENLELAAPDCLPDASADQKAVAGKQHAHTNGENEERADSCAVGLLGFPGLDETLHVKFIDHGFEFFVGTVSVTEVDACAGSGILEAFVLRFSS